jgi:ribonuclease III
MTWGLPKLKRAASALLSSGGRSEATESVPLERIAVSANATLMQMVDLLPTELLEQALTHSSWVTRRTGSYERLEFLGDSVLGLAIAGALYQRYPDKEEGELARIKAFVVSRASCVQVAGRLGLSDLIMERSPASPQRRKEAAGSSNVLGNILEALIGACFLGHGYDRTAAAVVGAFDGQISYAFTGHVDHKTTLQELLALRGVHPIYRLVAEEGPPHARQFTSEVWIVGEFRGRGTGTTIKMSEQHAAREALASLKSRVGE